MPYFRYGTEALDHLRKRDRKLGALIDRIGRIEREVSCDLFSSLVRAIIAQQISSKAAVSIAERLRLTLGTITPATIAEASVETMRACGLSSRKILYIKGVAEEIMAGRLDLDALPALSDREVVERLVGLKGIGVWSAEMLMIFSLQRPDILSWNDLAIRRGMRHLYGLKELDRERFEILRKRYSPYGSVASLYLWAVAGGQV